jgi:lysophospholipase L1-like esterase
MWKSYMAIGDSITEGWGDSVPGLECHSWSDWVAEALIALEPELEYRNTALRGTTTADVIRDQLPLVLATRPELVSVTIGGNDARSTEWTPEQFEREFTELASAVTSAGAQLITFTYPDIRPAVEAAGVEIRASWQLYFGRISAVDAVIRDVSSRVDACLIDFEHYAPASDIENLSADFTHPNARGYRLAADFALGVLSQRFGLPDLAAR